MSTPPVYLLAGAFAGACASGLTTPFDVLKTRVGTSFHRQGWKGGWSDKQTGRLAKFLYGLSRFRLLG